MGKVNAQITLECYTIPRGFSDPKVHASRLGFYQINKFEINEDCLDNPMSKFSTYEDIGHTRRSDYLIAYAVDRNVKERKPFYIGLVDSADVTTVKGQRNTISCRPASTVMDFDFVAVPDSTSTNGSGIPELNFEEHIALLARGFIAPYDIRIENIANDAYKVHPAMGGNLWFKYNATSWGADGKMIGTPWSYQPSQNFTATNMLTYLFGGFKKYGVMVRPLDINWTNTETVVGGSTAIQQRFPTIRMGIGNHDYLYGKDSTKIHAIKDNMSDLFDWEFSTTVGTTVVNACVIFNPEWKKNQQATIRNVTVNGQTEKKVIYTLGSSVHATELSYDSQANTGNYYDQSTGIIDSTINKNPEKYRKRYFYLTTAGDIVDGGVYNIPPIDPENPVALPLRTRVIVLDPEDSDRPLYTSGAQAGQPNNEYAALSAWYLRKAQDLLAMGAYAHEFKVKLRLDSKNINWRTDLRLGKEIEVTFKGIRYASIVSAFSLSDNNNYITITLGHNRNKIAPALRDIME